MKLQLFLLIFLQLSTGRSEIIIIQHFQILNH